MQKNWKDLSNQVTIDKIKESFKFYGLLFNRNLSRFEMLPKNDPTDSRLISVYHGNLDGIGIIKNISRHSLYSDKIIVFHPLQNPSNTNPEMSPSEFPAKWRTHFVNCLYFYVVLAPWIRTGFVELIESPFQYDQSLYTDLNLMAHERVKKSNFFQEDLKETHYQTWKDTMGKQLATMMTEAELTKLILEKGDIKEESKAEKLAKELKDYSSSLPLHVDFKGLKDDERGEILTTKTGASIEEVKSLCKIVGGHSFTADKLIKRQLQSLGDNPFWTKFGILYSGLPFKYLDKVDTRFALKIRNEERVSGVRNAIRDLYSLLNNNQLSEIREDQLVNFKDRFEDAILASETEWDQIKTEAKAKNTAAIFGSGLIQVMVDPTKILIPAIGIPTSLAVNEFLKRRKIKHLTTKDPFTVFAELKNRQPSFFSDIRRSLM